MKKIKLSVKQKEFLKELEGLLLKYNVEIYWTCDEWCSDTSGLIDNKIVIDMVGQKDNVEFKSACIDKYGVNKMLKGDDEDGNNNI